VKRSDLHALDLTQFPATLRWRTVATTGGAPCLSRHSCTAVGSRLVVVGGWNGRIRSPFVHFLDLATAVWTHPEVPMQNGPSGITNHTTTRVATLPPPPPNAAAADEPEPAPPLDVWRPWRPAAAAAADGADDEEDSEALLMVVGGSAGKVRYSSRAEEGEGAAGVEGGGGGCQMNAVSSTLVYASPMDATAPWSSGAERHHERRSRSGKHFPLSWPKARQY
jgi:hypothetical protein